MSGIEAVGIVLGVLSLIPPVIKGYQSVSNALGSFRRHNHVVLRLHEELKIPKGLFLNECRLLLRMIIDDADQLEDMFTDLEHSNWRSQELAEDLKNSLEENYGLCKQILEETNAKIGELELCLKKHSRIATDPATSISRAEVLRKAVKKLRTKTCIVLFDERRCNDILVILNKRNDALLKLRSQLSDLQDQKLRVPPTKHARVPAQVLAVRRASQGLYDSWVSSWRCADLNHYHYASLSLKDEGLEDPELRLVVLSFRGQTERQRCTSIPIWLKVEYSSANSSPALQNSTSLAKTAMQILPGPSLTKPATPASTTLANIPQIATVHAIPPPMHEAPEPPINFHGVRDICIFLREKVNTFNPRRLKSCLGNLRTTTDYTQEVYIDPENTPPARTSNNTSSSDIMSLDLFVQQHDETNINMLDRLKLAHSMALGFLQFQSTSWLQPNRRIHDLFVMHQQSDLNSRKLLLSRELPPTTSADGSTSTLLPQIQPSHVARNISDADARLIYGVKNIALFSLGAAFLEVAKWNTVEGLVSGMASGPVDDNYIVGLRRLVSTGRETHLGPAFQRLILKCVEGDLGPGGDLSVKIHHEIVVPLEKIIAGLEGTTVS